MDDSATPLIHAEHVSQTRPGSIHFRELDFKLKPGETYCILSPQPLMLNQILKFIEQSEKPDEGVFSLFGKPVENGAGVYGGKLMVMGRESTVISCLSIAENICIHDSSRERHSRKKKEDYIRTLMERTGLWIELSKSIKDCSVTEKKAVELLRICAARPRAVVLFDVMNEMSAEDGDKLAGVLEMLKKEGSGILYLTSRMEEALAVADRMSVLEKDTFHEIGDMDAVRHNSQELVRRMLGWEFFPENSENGDDEKVAALKSIINARELWVNESKLKQLLLYYAEDMTKVFGAGSTVIYLFDEEMSSIIDFISENEEVTRCSRMKSERVADLLRQDGMIHVFHEKEILEGDFFPEENMIKTMFCYSVWMEGKQCALIQLAFLSRKELDPMTREYLEIFAREIRFAVENARLLEQSALLQESHHRIKNNLQTIANLLYLQKTDGDSAEDVQIDKVLDSAIARVKSIASVHNLLSGDGSHSSTIVNLRKIILEVCKLYAQDFPEISVDMENISVPYNRATSIALMINELINNAVKYAYPETSRHKVIEITGRNLGTVIRVDVRDYGTGLLKGAPAKGSGLGMAIIDSVVGSMNGKIEYKSENGVKVTIELPRSTLMPIVKADSRF